MQNQKIESCSHCNEKIITPILSPRNPNLKFCCHGCCNVYEILEENNLEDYYKYRDTSQTSSVRLSNQKFKYIDDQKFEVQYVKVIGDQKIMKFYLEGVHCLACLWLLEKLPLLSKEIYASELDMGKSVLKIILAKEAKFSQVAKLIESLGYPPHPISDDMNTEKLKRKEDHQDLIRIVISFFCAGNIMLMAFSIYAGATNIIKTYFDYISAILFLPICLYSAIPFYKSALGSLKTKTISIDIPIVIALIGGSLWSYYNTLRSNEHIYFDTLAILVFLLLTTRFILKKTQQKGLAASEITNFFTNIATTKIEDGKEIEIHARYLDIDDTIKVHPGETIPCDGVIKNGNTSLNTSLLTGEVIPQTVKVGDTVYSGTTNLESDIIITVKKDYKHSKLGKILEDVERGWKQKSKIITKTDNIAKKFLLIVLGISILTFLYFTLDHQFETAFNRTLAIIIITCPCALGLTPPFTLALTLSKLARIGVIVKNPTVLENIIKARNIFFDKTGTLTRGHFTITKWEELTNNKFHDILFTLEQRSKHPIAKSLIEYISKNNPGHAKIKTVKNHRELVGRGPEALINDHWYQVMPIESKQTNATVIGLYKEGELVTRITLEDEVKASAEAVVSQLKTFHLTPYIISGDSVGPVHSTAKKLNIPLHQAFYTLTPEDKADIIKSTPNSIVIGDGANDAIALSYSLVGIAVHGSVDISLRACDVFLSKNNLDQIIKLLTTSRETYKIINRNIAFSFLYNLVGISLACTGYITPIVAAILMPVSSLTILISSVIGNKKWRNALSYVKNS